MTFLKQLLPQYRDFRFWGIQAVTIAGSAMIALQIRNYGTTARLNEVLQSPGPIQLYVFLYLMVTMAAATLFGYRAAIATIVIAAIFFLPDGIELKRAESGGIILLRLGAMSLLSVATGFIVERQKKARRLLLALNARLNENILEKERYIRLAGEAQENERRRISRDLHDDSLQLLAAATMDIDQAIESASPEKIRENMLRAKETLTLTSETIRRYCEELRPILLESMGLTQAVEYLVKDLESRAKMGVNFETLGEERELDSLNEVHLFRIMQEAFHNIERHSRATSVEVKWEYHQDHLAISVTDNGVGMWNFGPAPARSLGIQGMHERIELLGGTISFESRPGYGTRILLTIPTS
ncbi:MAG: sensor histidine kinase [Actinobacteria bacterium]|nr:sensor histidine kinase [Actinomycetota bacterium]